MFPSTGPPRRTSRRLRIALLRATDLAIAFATLESYGIEDLRPCARSVPADRQDRPPRDGGEFVDPSPDWALVRVAEQGAPEPVAKTAPRHRVHQTHQRRPGTRAVREQSCRGPIATF